VGAMRTMCGVLREGEAPAEPNQDSTGASPSRKHDRFLAAVRANRTVVTNGPLLRFAVADGRATATAESVVPFDKLEVVANGAVFATTPPTPTRGRHRATLDIPHAVTDGWLAARAVGPKGSLLYPDQPAFAHTSAVFVGTPVRPPAARTALRQCLAGTREWVETQGQFTAEKFAAELLDALTAAEATLVP